MSIGGGDEQLAVVARQSAQWCSVRVNERSQDFRYSRFGGALLAGEGKGRIGAVVDQRGQSPRDDQDEVAI
jgi:hypothetical protein